MRDTRMLTHACMRMQRAHTYWARPRTHTVRYLNTAPRPRETHPFWTCDFFPSNVKSKYRKANILLYETHTSCSLHIQSYIAHVCAYGAVFNSAPSVRYLFLWSGIGKEIEECGWHRSRGGGRASWGGRAIWATWGSQRSPACLLGQHHGHKGSGRFYLRLGDGQPHRHSTVSRRWGSGSCLALELCHKVQ
jgi:hypothetical protein